MSLNECTAGEFLLGRRQPLAQILVFGLHVRQLLFELEYPPAFRLHLLLGA